MPESKQTAREFSFPKAARILKRRQFLALTNRRGRPDLTIKAGSFLALAAHNEIKLTRLGVTVTKKVGSAVTRNRLKRRVREFFRLNVKKWPGGLDLVFIARHTAGGRSPAELAADLERISKKLICWPEKNLAVNPASKPGESGQPKSKTAGGAPSSEPTGKSGDLKHFSPEKSGSPAPFASAPDFGPVPGNGGWLNELSMSLWRLPSQLALAFIFFYQKCISPMLPPSCRFRPTCSGYAVEAIKIHGFWRGLYLTGRRLLKCHPFHPGGYDPVPPKK